MINAHQILDSNLTLQWTQRHRTMHEAKWKGYKGQLDAGVTDSLEVILLRFSVELVVNGPD